MNLIGEPVPLTGWAPSGADSPTTWMPAKDYGYVNVGFPIKEIKVVGDKVMLLNADTNEWTFFDDFEVRK